MTPSQAVDKHIEYQAYANEVAKDIAMAEQHLIKLRNLHTQILQSISSLEDSAGIRRIA